MKQKLLADNIHNLPKWAQTEIKTLQMRLREAKDELRRIQENAESNTVLGSPYVFQDEPIQYLKNNQKISFILERGYIQAGIEKGYLNIYASGEGELNLRPNSSNVIQLHLK